MRPASDTVAPVASVVAYDYLEHILTVPVRAAGIETRFIIDTGIGDIAGMAQYRVSGPDVMFQKIIHQGLIGDAILRHFITTYDLTNSRMIFSLPRRCSR